MISRESPTAQLLVLFVLVHTVSRVGSLVGIPSSLFLLADPFVRPWTILISVYAHGSIAHLLGNAVALALVGFALERSTTPARFHAFFLLSGALSGVVQVLVSGAFGREVAVLGASGAVLALFGYVATSNPLSTTLFGLVDVSRRVQLAVFGVVAASVTLLTAAPGVALVSHFTGLGLGFAAGRRRVLQVENATLK